MNKTRICDLLNIELPIIQAGMVWVSGGNLAAAAAEAGCLGVIGAGSMNVELLEKQIQKAKAKTNKSLAVNLPILYSQSQDQIDVAIKNGIKIFITSAGSPKKYTGYLKEKGCTVIHVCSTPELAVKCEQAGVDAIVVEGFEAGGHNGRDELTSMVLIPQCVKAVKIPVIAAGGFASGASIVAGMALGAEGIQMGTRFMLTKESSAHQNYKDLLLKSKPGDTMLMMKKHIPVRLYKNKFYEEVLDLENQCADAEKLKEHLGKGRARKGMLEGNLEEGELETGQICSYIEDLPTVYELVTRLTEEYQIAIKKFF